MIYSTYRRWLFITITVLFSICSYSHSDTSISSDDTIMLHDNTNENDTKEKYVEDEIGSLFLLTIAGAVMLFCFGIGVVISLCIILIALVLFMVGILSTSFAVGIYQKSLTAAFKTMIISTSTITGLGLGLVGTFGLFKILHWPMITFGVISGGLSGAIAGLCFGYFLVFLFRKLGKMMLKRTP